MLRKNKIWQLFAIAGLILTYALLLKYGFMSIREFGLITVTILAATACMEYNKKKWTDQFRRQADKKLASQADRFHDELWNLIFSKTWGRDELDALKDMLKQFNQIRPSTKYTKTNPKYSQKKTSHNRPQLVNLSKGK